LTPKRVTPVNTKFRRIQTPIPAPESIPILEALYRDEPRSMRGQGPVVWDRAEGFQVHDAWGNTWLDWSSGVLVASAGHGRPEIARAICEQANKSLLHNYCFASEERARLVSRIAALAPKPLAKVFLLTTGAETTEAAIKLARTHGKAAGGNRKIGIVSYEGAFHGRTMGAQMIGGIPALKEWIVNLDPDMVQVPFPDDLRCADTSFEFFLKSLKDQGFGPDRIAGVISETYQGGSAAFWPSESEAFATNRRNGQRLRRQSRRAEYAQKMRAWCTEHDIVLAMDEVQAGFGRTGTMWGFEHYGIVPDLVCCGKAITSGLPLSALIGRADLMDQYPPGSMTSTHTGNPVCVAAALANLDIVVNEKLPEKAAQVGAVLHAGLRELQRKHPDIIAAVMGKGMVAGMHIVMSGGIEPWPELATAIWQKCTEKGLLMFHPVGLMGATVKIAPPLITPEEAVLEGVTVLGEAIQEARNELL
jgi:4-aminobutyrate aminotransferase/diaminobutyrate-pyruvate transaminase/4-aminobutyrate aminotransferase/(S)-3-amino-2-methylpropionate transaminase